MDIFFCLGRIIKTSSPETPTLYVYSCLQLIFQSFHHPFYSIIYPSIYWFMIHCLPNSVLSWTCSNNSMDSLTRLSPVWDVCSFGSGCSLTFPLLMGRIYRSACHAFASVLPTFHHSFLKSRLGSVALLPLTLPTVSFSVRKRKKYTYMKKIALGKSSNIKIKWIK